jgi:hypothetical protein
MFDPANVDTLCLILAVAGLLLGILGAVSIRLAYPLPTAPVDRRCRCQGLRADPAA